MAVPAESISNRRQHTVPQGIIAILESGTDRSLVNFDPRGWAVLTDGKGDAAPAKQVPGPPQ